MAGISIRIPDEQLVEVDARKDAEGYSSRSQFLIHSALSRNQFENSKVADIHNALFPILKAESFPSIQLFVLDYLFRRKLKRVYLPQLAKAMKKDIGDFVTDLGRLKDKGLVSMITDMRGQLYLRLTKKGLQDASVLYLLVNRLKHKPGDVLGGNSSFQKNKHGGEKNGSRK